MRLRLGHGLLRPRGALGAADWRAPFWLYAVGLLIAPVMARVLPTPLPSKRDDVAAARIPRSPFPVRRMAGICLLTVFGAVVFYTVPVEMAYLLDDLGTDSTSAIGAVTAVVAPPPFSDPSSSPASRPTGGPGCPHCSRCAPPASC